MGEAENVTLHDLLESIDFRVTGREVLEYELGLVRDFVGLFAQLVTPFDAHQVFLHRFCSDNATIAAANEFLGTLVIHSGIANPLADRVGEVTLVSLFVYLEITNRSDVLSDFVTQYLSVLEGRRDQLLGNFRQLRRDTLKSVTRLTKDPKLQEKVRLLEMVDYPPEFLSSGNLGRISPENPNIGGRPNDPGSIDFGKSEEDGRSTVATLSGTGHQALSQSANDQS